MQLRFRHIARNVFSNWLATAANMGVGFFLSPFIVHRLGNEAYGIWVLAISSIGYLGLLDLGMRSSVLRFVSKGHTKGDHQGTSEALSAALWVRLQISGVILLASAVLAYVFPLFFKVPARLAIDARWAVMIIGLNLAITMSMGVFGGVISALNRYDLQTRVTLLQLIIRVTGVVFVLRHGYGIVAIALCELAAALLGNVMLVNMARRLYPQLQLLWRRPDREILRALWSYSVYAFMTSVAIQLVYQTDNLVVGTFVSASAVTFYAIGNALCRYTDQFTGAMTMSFVPAASTYEAAGDVSKLRSLYQIGTRAIMALSLPIIATLLVRGRTFIGLWMGPQYTQRSGTVLIILAMALIFSQANNAAFAIAFGTERHKVTARWAVIEGVSNLVLSVTLVHFIGINGVAVGTLLPSLFFQVVMWPRYIGKMLDFSPWAVIFKVWAPMLLCVVPFGVASYALNAYMPPHSIAMFLLQTVALLPVFLVVVAAVFREQVRLRVLPAARSFWQNRVGAPAH